ncbi:MAG: hypothetical protein AAFY72_06940, partial [Cyanobacteria bacterium J06649_4]
MSQGLLGRYLKFLRLPELTSPPATISQIEVLRDVLRLYAPHLLLCLLASLLTQFFGVSGLESDFWDTLSAKSLLLLAVLIAPIYEEAIFRLPLYPLATNLSLSGSIAALL